MTALGDPKICSIKDIWRGQGHPQGHSEDMKTSLGAPRLGPHGPAEPENWAGLEEACEKEPAMRGHPRISRTGRRSSSTSIHVPHTVVGPQDIPAPLDAHNFAASHSTLPLQNRPGAVVTLRVNWRPDPMVKKHIL